MMRNDFSRNHMSSSASAPCANAYFGCANSASMQSENAIIINVGVIIMASIIISVIISVLSIVELSVLVAVVGIVAVILVARKFLFLPTVRMLA